MVKDWWNTQYSWKVNKWYDGIIFFNEISKNWVSRIFLLKRCNQYWKQSLQKDVMHNVSINTYP